MAFVVAIDGPAGTGKGTITKLISQELGLVNIDTGAMYRCITLKAIRKGINSLEKSEELIQIAKDSNIYIENHNGNQQTFLDGENVTTEIRSKEVSDFVSQLSSIPEIREIVVNLARQIADGKDVIMEGRDITTVVFPEAQVKIYLDADIEERAKRRFKENQEKGWYKRLEIHPYRASAPELQGCHGRHCDR